MDGKREERNFNGEGKVAGREGGRERRNENEMDGDKKVLGGGSG